MFPRDIVFLRNISTLHKGDDDDDDDDDNNNNIRNPVLHLSKVARNDTGDVQCVILAANLYQ